MRKLTLLLALFLLLMGMGHAWSETLTEDFNNVQRLDANGNVITSNYTYGSSLSNGWIASAPNIIGASNSYHYGIASDGNEGMALWAGYGATQNYYMIIPTQLVGEVKFQARKTSSNASTYGYISLYEATESNGTFTVTSTKLGETISPTSNSIWNNYSINIGEEPKYVALHMIRCGLDNFEATIYVDNGAIARPNNFIPSNITINSVDLTWTAGGEETAWQLVYDTNASFDKDAATPIDITTNPYTLSGLSENTTYYAYLRAKIGDDVSSWTSKISFTTEVQFPVPTGFALTGYTATTASFGWTAGSTETAWQIAYSTDENFDPATSGTTVDVTENPYTLENLTAETTYYAYLRANYGNGYSAWSEKISFTPSNTMNTLINDGSDTNDYVPVYGYYTDNLTWSQMIIPSASVSSVLGRQIDKLTFYASQASVSWENATFDVYIGETSNTEFSSTTADWSNLTRVYSGTLSISGNKMEVVFEDGYVYDGGNLIIGINQTATGSYVKSTWYGVNGSTNTTIQGYGTSNKNYRQFLPKMTITSVPYVAPAVKKPSNLTASNITASSAQLSWMDGEDGLTAWEIKYSTTENFDPATEGIPVSADANPYTLTDLTAETTYYAYVRAKKGTDYSDWSNMVAFMPTATIDITINDGSSTTEYLINGYYCDQYQKAEFVIPASDLTDIDGGIINSLTLHIAKQGNKAFTSTFNVFLKEVESSTISSFVGYSEDEVLYSGVLDTQTSTLTIPFSSAYEYNGGNLLVGIYNTTKGTYTTSGTPTFYGKSSSGSMVSGYNSSSLSGVRATQRDFLPKTTFNYLPGTPKGKMVVSTDAIDFGKITPASSAADKQKTFTISNTGKADLTNIAVTYSDAYDPDAFSLNDNIATSIAQNGEAIIVTVTMDATTAGTYTGTITINADDQTEKTITVTGEYSSVPAEMAVTYDNADVPATVAFGTVNKQTVKTFSVTNDGDMPLNVTSIISSNTTDFTVSPATLTVAGGEAEEFTVTFLYDESDLDIEKTATITVTPSNEGLSAVSFEVTGTRSDFWSEDFSGNSLPTGWDAGANWTIENGVAKATFVYGTTNYLTTPTLTVSATSDVMTFEYKATANNVNVKIQYSKDGGAFTDYSGTPSWISAMTEPATFTITGLSAGYYQFRFANDDFELDNFEGFKLAPAPIVLDQESSTNSIVVGVQNVTLNYVFSKASGRNYNTIALPFDLEDLSIFGEGVTAYTLKSYDADNNNITFSDVETLEAGKPYLLHADTPTTETSFTFYNVDVTEVAEGETAVTGATFHANYNYKAAGDITGTWYGINSTSGNVQKAGPTTHLLGFRAYITFDTEVDPARLNVTFVSEGSEGEATTIKGTELMNSQNGDIYDLQGRKVNNAQKGIYIQNGKKVVIK